MEHRRLAEIIEMIHTASLIHDDVLDESDMRRGRHYYLLTDVTCEITEMSLCDKIYHLPIPCSQFLAATVSIHKLRIFWINLIKKSQWKVILLPTA